MRPLNKVFNWPPLGLGVLGFRLASSMSRAGNFPTLGSSVECKHNPILNRSTAPATANGIPARAIHGDQSSVRKRNAATGLRPDRTPRRYSIANFTPLTGHRAPQFAHLLPDLGKSQNALRNREQSVEVEGLAVQVQFG